MQKKLTPEQFKELYQKLPEELQDALFDEKTGNNTFEICQRNNIENYLDDVAYFIKQTLIGFLPPEDFQETLEKELNIKNEVAKVVTREINRFIFFPLKSFLEELYKTKTTTSEKMITQKNTKSFLGLEKRNKEQDLYRESIE